MNRPRSPAPVEVSRSDSPPGRCRFTSMFLESPHKWFDKDSKSMQNPSYVCKFAIAILRGGFRRRNLTWVLLGTPPT
jgi:hypothetical protein